MKPDQLRRHDWDALVVEARDHVQSAVKDTRERLFDRWALRPKGVN